MPDFMEGTSADISIHALREEGDQGLPLNRTRFEIFLSTPSARRATYSAIDAQLDGLFLSTPSARRATETWREGIAWKSISIHALREEGDSKNRDKISIFL